MSYRTAKFYTSVAQVSRGSAIILQTCPAAKFSDWTIHYWGSFRLWFMIFLESHLTASLRQTSAILPSFMSFLVHSAEPRFPLREKLSALDRALVYENVSTSLSVHFHYHVTTNHSCDKSTRLHRWDNIHLSKDLWCWWNLRYHKLYGIIRNYFFSTKILQSVIMRMLMPLITRAHVCNWRVKF